jgi:hypothetical protein
MDNYLLIQTISLLKSAPYQTEVLKEKRDNTIIELKKLLNIYDVVKSLPDKKEITKLGFDKASKHKQKNSKVNKIDYGFGFIDGAEWMKEILNK